MVLMDSFFSLLDQFSGTAITLAGALALAILAYWIISTLLNSLLHRKIAKGFDDFASPVENIPDAQMGSAAYKMRTAFAAYGIDAAGKEETVFYTAWTIIGVLAALVLITIRLNAVLALAAGAGIGYLTLQAIVAGRWDKTCLEIDSEVPTFLRNLSGIIQTESNVIQALDSASESLDPRKPLYSWIIDLNRGLQARGKAVFRIKLPEAGEISSALGIAVFEIERLWDAGGEGYTRAFKLTADNLAEILTVKAQAASKSTGATGLAKLIIASAVLSIGYIIMSPVGQEMYLDNPMVKLAMVGAVIWGIYGWIYIKEMVREATE